MDVQNQQAWVELLEKRIDNLKGQIGVMLDNTEPQKREERHRQIKGRIKECRKLKEVISEGKMEDYT